MKYKIRERGEISVLKPSREICQLPTGMLHNAVHATHEVLHKFTDFDVDVFDILGMRNLSSFIGELYAASVRKFANGWLQRNPHQDGYPDLLLMDKEGEELWAALQDQLRAKAPFSPYAAGGIEVKATCGSVPTPKQCAKKGFEKPAIGDSRIICLKGYDWKSHHRETNNLLGLLWDFHEGMPMIMAVFYSSSLTEEDWGEIVRPKKDGGRTTSVSVMKRDGVRRMYEDWVLVADDERYKSFIDRYNKGALLS